MQLKQRPRLNTAYNATFGPQSPSAVIEPKDILSNVTQPRAISNKFIDNAGEESLQGVKAASKYTMNMPSLGGPFARDRRVWRQISVNKQNLFCRIRECSSRQQSGYASTNDNCSQGR